jgi:hypothetical protein
MAHVLKRVQVRRIVGPLDDMEIVSVVEPLGQNSGFVALEPHPEESVLSHASA